MRRVEQVEHAPAAASKGKVRMPPGRLVSVRAKKSSNARPRNRLKPRSRATLVTEGAEIMRSTVEVDEVGPWQLDRPYHTWPDRANEEAQKASGG
jgi:hypothetical protein